MNEIPNKFCVVFFKFSSSFLAFRAVFRRTSEIKLRQWAEIDCLTLTLTQSGKGLEVPTKFCQVCSKFFAVPSGFLPNVSLGHGLKSAV